MDTGKKTKSNQCRYFDYCEAPLCPLDEKHLKIGIWYPNEEICRLKKSPGWIKRQKKVAKKAKDRNKYFTHQMLNHNFIVRGGIEGLDPDQIEEVQLERWFKKHPLKRPKTENQLKAIKAMLEKRLLDELILSK